VVTATATVAAAVLVRLWREQIKESTLKVEQQQELTGRAMYKEQQQICTKWGSSSRKASCGYSNSNSSSSSTCEDWREQIRESILKVEQQQELTECAMYKNSSRFVKSGEQLLESILKGEQEQY
jgi:hypothetical protein